MVGDGHRWLPGRHDVRTRDGRDRGGGDASRGVRFRREAAVARKAAAHRGARAGRGQTPPPVRQAPGPAADGAGGQEQDHAAAARRAAADRRQHLLRAADRRAGLRPRGLRALSARAGAPGGPAVSDPRRQQLARGGRRHGLLEEAGDGTLFIHEIEDLPPTAQRLLVGVLESGRFTRIGGSEPVNFGARVLSSAQPGIENRAGAEGLRRDLLAHLNMLIVRVPPLRDYAEDVPELLRHYVDRVVDGEGLPFRRFSVAAQNRLRNYPWPDNVRGLKNLVHRLLIQGGSEEIRLEEIERELAVQAPPGEPLVKQD